MDSYVEFRIFPESDLAGPHVLTAIYAKLHRLLAARGKGDIGVSFPDADIKSGWAGLMLRVHGSRQALEQLFADGWAERFVDYARVSDVRPVPDSAQHRSVYRVQAKTNPERLRRRAMKRHGLTREEALQRIPDSARKKLDLPHVWLRSSSTGERFCLFFTFGKPRQTPQKGQFSAYGLSAEATVPWF